MQPPSTPPALLLEELLDDELLLDELLLDELLDDELLDDEPAWSPPAPELVVDPPALVPVELVGAPPLPPTADELLDGGMPDEELGPEPVDAPPVGCPEELAACTAFELASPDPSVPDDDELAFVPVEPEPPLPPVDSAVRDVAEQPIPARTWVAPMRITHAAGPRSPRLRRISCCLRKSTTPEIRRGRRSRRASSADISSAALLA